MKYHITLSDLLLKKELIVNALKDNQKTIIYGNFYTDEEDKTDVRKLMKTQQSLREDLILIKSTIQKVNFESGKDKIIYELTEFKQQLFAVLKMIQLHPKKTGSKFTIGPKELQAEKVRLESKIESCKSALTIFNDSTKVEIELTSEISLPTPLKKLA